VFFYKLDYTSQQTDCLLLKVLFNLNLKSQVCFDGEKRRQLEKTYLFHPIWRMFVYQLNVGISAITRPDTHSLVSIGQSKLK